MDNPALPPAPPTPPPISVKPKPSLPKILFILIPLLAIAALAGFIYFKHPFNLLQPKKIITTPTENPPVSNMPVNVQESSPSAEGIRIYPKYNTIGFSGQVKEKGENYLVLTGNNQTIKVEVSNPTRIRKVKIAEFGKNPNPPSSESFYSISFADIKTGNKISVLGTGNTQLLKAVSIIVTR